MIKWYQGMKEDYAVIELPSIVKKYVIMTMKHGHVCLYPSEEDVEYFTSLEFAEMEILELES